MRIWKAGERPKEISKEPPDIVLIEDGFEHYLGKIKPGSLKIMCMDWDQPIGQAFRDIEHSQNRY